MKIHRTKTYINSEFLAHFELQSAIQQKCNWRPFKMITMVVSLNPNLQTVQLNKNQRKMNGQLEFESQGKSTEYYQIQLKM